MSGAKMMSVFLGDDLVMEILFRLPAKPLVRCKSLSKSFHTLISNFISRNKPTLTMSGLLCEDFGTNSRNSIRHVDLQSSPGIEERVVSNIINGMKNIPHCIIKSHQNGLLLLSTFIREIYYVCNPLTNKWFALPYLPTLAKREFFTLAVLAFDPHISPHYKVISILVSSSSRSIFGFRIFSSETGIWLKSKMFEPPFASYKGYGTKGTVSLNGVVFVLSANNIIEFDVEEGSFREIQVPEPFREIQVRENISFLRGICVSGGFLHYLAHSENQLRIWVFMKCHNSPAGEWILKKSILVKTITETVHNDIELPPVVFHPDFIELRPMSLHPDFIESRQTPFRQDCMDIRPVAFHPDFDIVFVKIFHKVYSYDLNRMRFQELYTYNLSSSTTFYAFTPCLYDALPSALPIGW
ncbi:F-box protein At5g07610-like isoform X1 [Tasmannia lanceolata]|uniref:F-box protein At5g07610-like isoform X1 n=1 Tax=Tasmannia lanceolata TaxID=3420 RepID=UPI0040640516